MTATLDLRMLCTALGFFTVAVRDGQVNDKNAARAIAIARLAEEFCLINAAGPRAPSRVAQALLNAQDEAEDIYPEDNLDDERFDLHRRMAEIITAIIDEKGECAPRDLKTRGFTPEETERGWPLAYGLAQAALNRTDA